MTFSDLIDQITSNAGDDSSTYRAKCRRWLNLTRSDIGSDGLWKWALRAEATFDTAAATTSGIYPLTDSSVSSDGFEFLLGDSLIDRTNNRTIRHESMASMHEIDHDKETFGPPSWWGDAGATDAGVRRIYLWPIPEGTYTILFDAYKMLTDVDETQDALEIDPFFGPISVWAGTMAAGMRYYYDLDNNEDPTQTAIQHRQFMKQISKRRTHNRLSLSAPQRLHILTTQAIGTVGRFDPAHYANR